MVSVGYYDLVRAPLIEHNFDFTRDHQQLAPSGHIPVHLN
jgi:hypothetical protein